jgi:hypothetical protein
VNFELILNFEKDEDFSDLIRFDDEFGRIKIKDQ